MRDSNCFNVYVGFESINPRTLKLFQKKQDLAKIERSIERFHDHKIRIHGMFVVGSDEDDVETIDATAGVRAQARHRLHPVHDPHAHSRARPTGTGSTPRATSTCISRNWTFYDGHHAVHQPRRMSPYELQMAAISAMAKFYSWRRHRSRSSEGRHVLRDHPLLGQEDDPASGGRTTRTAPTWSGCKAQLYGERHAARHRALKTVGLPEILLQDSLGRLLQRFLGELGVTVVPLAEAAVEEGAAARARQTDRLPDHADRQAGRAGARGVLRAADRGDRRSRSSGRGCPGSASRSSTGQGPVFEPFAKIGLLFTRNLDSIRDAYRRRRRRRRTLGSRQRLSSRGASTAPLEPPAASMARARPALEA